MCKIFNARAQLLFYSLNLLFGDVLVAVVVEVCAPYSIDARLASEMPLLFSSDNCRLGAALFRSLSQASQYAMLLPAVYPSTSSFSSNIEHLLQVGNSHLKHLYLVLMKQEQHISIMLCDVSNDFRHSRPAFFVPQGCAPFGQHQKERGLWGRECIPGRQIVFVQRMLVRGENSVRQMGEYVFL